MRFRVLNAVASAVLIGYNLAIQVWPMVGLNVVLVGINVGVIWGLLRKRHDARAYDVVALGVKEPFLARLLPEAEHAFLVSSGDELVGVVLARAGDTPDEQQVVLDYVLPPYRDFTPGEFVFRPDGPFAQMGARRVVASPAMAASERYLEAVGFLPDGARQVLDLAGGRA